MLAMLDVMNMMNAILLVVALLALVLAVSQIVQNRRASREADGRSAARVEALRAAGIEPADPDAVPVSTSHNLLENADRATATDERATGPFVVAVALALVVLALAVWNGRSTGTPASGRTAPVPLELVRLGHQRDGDTLLVSGVVRNPAPGSRVDNARVVLTAFNRAGALVSSITGPLDFRTLAPGDESPFMLTLEHADSVGRYRVSFRSAEEILPHVDRREAATAVTERR